MSAVATVKPTKDRTSSTSQKFWPLKKFNLSHHGKTVVDQTKKLPVKAIKTNIQNKEENAAAAASTTVTPTAATSAVTSTAPIATDLDAQQQKKSKNKRLSTLLSSSHRQEDESINNKNASNTPIITRKASRDIKAKTISKNSNYMTAKTAGSGTLTRTNSPPSPTSSPPTATAVFNRAQSMTNKTSTKKSSKHTRPQSPPTKQQVAAVSTTNEQPKIMLESVQQQIQREEKEKIKKQQQQQQRKLSSNSNNDVDYDSAIEDEQEDEQELIKVVNTTTDDNSSNNIKDNKGDVIAAVTLPINLSNSSSTSNSIKSCSSSLSSSDGSCNSSSSNSSKDGANHDSSPLPSPPVTPAAISLPKFNIKEAASTGIMNIIHNEPISPTMCTFNVQSVQQPIQRIRRLRPAASFATLRQLASTNSNYQYQQQQLNYHNHQIQQLAAATTTTTTTTKRRPVSYIDSSTNMNCNYTIASPPSSVATNDDYLSVHSLTARPTYYRRASSEDNRQHYHTRQISDSNPSPPSSIVNESASGRCFVRSNTVHNLIIKDGQGHRIVQCVGLDDTSPPLQPLRKKTSGFENTNEHQDWSTASTTASELMDDNPAISLTRQQLEDLHFQVQHQQNQQLENDVPAIVDQHVQQRPRKIKRKDSAKSLSSLCSSFATNPPINHDTRCEQLKTKLEKERATVKALQKQKEAYNKDVLFLSKNVDELSAHNLEWKRKFDVEKTSKERFQDDLSSTMDKLNESTEQIRQLESQNRLLKQELDDKNKEIRELEEKNKSPVLRGKSTTAAVSTSIAEKSNDRLLAAQLQHSQNQVRLLKSTMEQFLRMGVFNDDLSNMTSPTASIDAVVSELRCGRSRQHRHPASTTTTKNTENDNNSDQQSNAITSSTTKIRNSLVPVDTKAKGFSKNNNSIPTAELDNQLLELLREKEILQAEYSKAPSSGGNALVRRRREELESRLDTVDSQMCRIKLKMRNRNIL